MEREEPAMVEAGRSEEVNVWPHKGLRSSGAWGVREHNELLAHCFGFCITNKA